MSGSTTRKRLSRNWVVEEDLATRELILRNDDTDRTITLGDEGSLEGELHVRDVDDLPDTNANGKHPVGDQLTVFHGTITHSNGLERVGDYPLVGHAGDAVLLYTGAGTQLTSDGYSSIVDGISFLAPSGTVLDETGTIDDEHLWLDCAIGLKPATLPGLSNPVVGNIGTVDGFRVPSYKGVNIEAIGAGFTFTGSPDKVFFEGCPMRNVTEAAVTFVELASDFSCSIVDVQGGFLKDVQSDTKVFDVDAGATISEIFQYKGQTHDATVTKSNILTGAAGVGVAGYRVSDSHPLPDSVVVGELDLGSEGQTVTIPAQDTYTTVAPTSSLGDEAERVTETSDGVLEYTGAKSTKVMVVATLTVEAPSNETFAVGISKNGASPSSDSARGEGAGNAPVPVTAAGIETLDPGDTLEIQIKNIDSASDLTLDLFDFNFHGS